MAKEIQQNSQTQVVSETAPANPYISGTVAQPTQISAVQKNIKEKTAQVQQPAQQQTAQPNQQQTSTKDAGVEQSETGESKKKKSGIGIWLIIILAIIIAGGLVYYFFFM